MRNLKKILALAIVFAMAFTFTASAANFTDQAEIGANYVDDVNMLVELGVIAGYPDGSYGPQKNITRAEFAKMAYTIKYGSDTDGNLFAAQKSAFTDVEGNANVAWAKGYINYCANQNIVSGVGNGKFNPSGNITVAEATKMLLVILGCDPAKEGFTGANWIANVTAKAIDLGIYNGWTGDPSQLATRELVAKLMRNTIFSSVYTYSAITGTGSQMDALGQNWNQTLGEQTMGLYHIEGIVVANERYALSTDEEGEVIDLSNLEATDDEEEALVYYVSKDIAGNEFKNLIEINRGLSDDMLGAKVDVYFTADVEKDRDGFIISYNNIEVMGNVLVNSDTVAYTVPAIATDVYPDGDSSSSTTVLPYIGFEVDGVQKTISVDKRAEGVTRMAKKDNAQNDVNVQTAFNHYGYILDTTVGDDSASTIWAGEHEDVNFIADMGYPVLSQYRFVSVDGGKTYSYMFKTVTDVANKANYGSVSNYSEAKGTVAITGIGTIDLEDCVINGEIATDDAVVYYRENGKLVITKVEVITGAVESFTDDGVMIGGNEYFAWAGCDLDTEETLFDYYGENKNAMNEATYYVYQNLIMEIDADEVAAAVENYAVILRSYYDEDMDTAYVKLGFADNTEGTYQIGKTYLKNSREPNSDENEGNRAQDFAYNSLFGAVVKYKVMANGAIDLSGNDFGKDSDFYTDNYKRGTDVDDDNFGVIADRLVWSGTEYYAYNDGSIVFALYGNPFYGNDGNVYASGDTNGDEEADLTGKYAPVKAKAYKLEELKDMTVDAIPNLYMGENGSNAETGSAGDYAVASVIFNSKSVNKYVVAAAVTVGETLAAADISYRETNALAYVVSAYQRYNSANDSYYADFTLINEDGLFTASTVEGVLDLNAREALEDDRIGNISNKGPGAGYYPAGTFVRFEMNADGVITTLDNTDIGDVDDIETTFSTANGLYLVNVTGERGNILSFFETKTGITDVSKAATTSCEYHEDGYDIIGIDDGTYVNEILTKISTRAGTSTEANVGNAIIEVDEGMIVRVFSFVDGWAK